VTCCYVVQNLQLEILHSSHLKFLLTRKKNTNTMNNINTSNNNNTTVVVVDFIGNQFMNEYVILSFPNVMGFSFRIPSQLCPPKHKILVMDEETRQVMFKTTIQIPPALLLAFRVGNKGQSFTITPDEALRRIIITSFRHLSNTLSTTSSSTQGNDDHRHLSMRSILATLMVIIQLELENISFKQYWGNKVKTYMSDAVSDIELANQTLYNVSYQQQQQQQQQNSSTQTSGESSQQQQHQHQRPLLHRPSHPPPPSTTLRTSSMDNHQLLSLSRVISQQSEHITNIQLQMEIQNKRIKELESYFHARQSFSAFHSFMNNNNKNTNVVPATTSTCDDDPNQILCDTTGGNNNNNNTNKKNMI
jgi:hypothetical protein